MCFEISYDKTRELRETYRDIGKVVCYKELFYNHIKDKLESPTTKTVWKPGWNKRSLLHFILDGCKYKIYNPEKAGRYRPPHAHSGIYVFTNGHRPSIGAIVNVTGINGVYAFHCVPVTCYLRDLLYVSRCGQMATFKKVYVEPTDYSNFLNKYRRIYINRCMIT
jgi:hypothetical protein